MVLLNLILLSALIILGMMTALWIMSLLVKNAGIVDIFWGLGFIIATWTAFVFTPQGYVWRKLLIAILVTIWGLRLASHIGIRNWSKPEDFRYAKWREENGARWWWSSFFKVFLLQGALMCILSAPIIAAQTSGFPAILTPLDFIGTLVWTFGFLFESIGDFQLMRFKANKSSQGEILTTGLWKYTRHPNYFGEAVLWWGYYLIALAAGFWWTIFSPILMTYLLRNVSGLAMLEKNMQTKPGFQKYMETTNALLPWIPKE